MTNFLFSALLLTLLPLISGGLNISLDHHADQLLLTMVPHHSVEPALIMNLDFTDHHLDESKRTEIKSQMAKVYRENKEPIVKIEDLSLHLLEGVVNTHQGKAERDGNCFSLSIKANSPSTSLSTCFPLATGVNWYAGIEMNEQHWPIEKMKIEKRPLTTTELGGQALAEPYFLNSKGLFLYFSPQMAAFYSIKSLSETDPAEPGLSGSQPPSDKQLCIYAENTSPYYRPPSSENYLNFTACKFDNPKVAQMKAVEYFLGKPKGIPDTKMVEWPIWTTWAKYKREIDDKKVIEYAQTILDNGFKNSSQLEIDDRWEVCYGAGEVDTKTFPNMKNTISQLKRMGFRTTMWVHPFVNIDCEPYISRFRDRKLLIHNLTDSYRTSWWNSKDLEAAHFDFTQPEVAEWFRNRLHRLRKEIGVDSFKFDAGETSFAPQVPQLNCPPNEHPGCLTRLYVKSASLSGPMIEYRSGAQTQYLPNYIRMLDRNSEWGFTAGLPTLITSTLALNIAGYPFVMPDMIGGNAYADQVCTEEMFVRWTQANVFMPILQFSLEPWIYGKRAVDLTLQLVNLHYKYSGKIIEAMKRAVKTGQPVNAPIWWVAPNDPYALACDDEYMLGDDILVAPVIKPGATSRPVYLPQGQWRDEADPAHPVIVGPRHILNYPAPLEVLPYFTRVGKVED